MAIYNEILAPRFARALQRLFAIKGEVPTKQLSGEIMPVFPLFNGRENRYLEDWDSFGFATQTPAQGAGNLSALRIRNPLTSNAIAVLEMWAIQATVADSYQWGYGTLNTDLGSVQVSPTSMDLRSNKQSSMIVSTGTGLASQFQNVRQAALLATVVADLIVTDIQEVVLTPGKTWQSNNGVANTACSFSLMWRERVFEPSESK